MAEWHAKLRALMKDRGLTQTDVSRKLGRNHAYIRQLLLRESYPALDDAYRIAAILGVSLDQIFHCAGYLPPRSFPIMGTVTDGGTIIPVPPDQQGTADIPPIGQDSVGYLVDVASMRYDVGDFVIGDKTLGPNVHNLISRECIVHTITGQLVLGVLTDGTKPNHFSVRFFDPTQPIIKDVQIEWAARVRHVIRRD